MDYNTALMNLGKGKQNKYATKEQLATIYNSFNGVANSIEDFWTTFIEKRLPDFDVVLKWHKALVEYANLDGAIFPIRNGNVKGSLRRGWLVRTNCNFSYFFTDNDLAMCIYKMALDGFYPSSGQAILNVVNDMKEAGDFPWYSKNKKFKHPVDNMHGKRRFFNLPVHFLKCGGKTTPDSLEPMKNVFVISGPTCCLGSYGYKHSHVFDAGKNYCLNNKTINMAEICKEDSYLPLMKVSDYIWDNGISNYSAVYNIKNEMKEDARKIAVACFLRFVDPINFFLAPKASNSMYIDIHGKECSDIAEYHELLSFIKGKFEAIYGKQVYDKYNELILAPAYTNNDGSLTINLKYSHKKLSSKDKSSNLTINNIASNKKTNKNNLSLNNIENEYIEYLLKIGNKSNNYVQAITNLKKSSYNLSYNNIDNLINQFKNHNDHGTIYNALKRYKEHYIYIKLKQIKSIPYNYFSNLIIEKMVIPSNIKRLDSNAFKDSVIKELYLEEGCLDEISGSFIFENCVNLNKVYAETYNSLKFKYDTLGHPYFRKTKVYLNKNEIQPIVYLKISKQLGVWNVISKHISEIEIVGYKCKVTYSENLKVINHKKIILNEIEYRIFVALMGEMKNITCLGINFNKPTIYDAPKPSLVAYKFFDEEHQNLTLQNSSQNVHSIQSLKRFLEDLVNEKITLF